MEKKEVNNYSAENDKWYAILQQRLNDKRGFDKKIEGENQTGFVRNIALAYIWLYCQTDNPNRELIMQALKESKEAWDNIFDEDTKKEATKTKKSRK